MKKYFIFIIFLHVLTCRVVCAETKSMSLDMQEAGLGDVIRVMAKFLHINVVISPAVQGLVTLHLQHAMPNQAMEALLVSHGLAKWQMGNTWYIAPEEEILKRRRNEIKSQELHDDALPLVTQTWQVHFGKAEDIARLFQDKRASLLSHRGQLHVDARTNVICIQDNIEKIQAANRLIHRLDVPVRQIMIEARLVDVDNDAEKELGIDYSVQSPSSVKPQQGRYSMIVGRLPDGTLLDIRLAALEREGRAELISSPSLFTANQQPASIEAGEEVPYQEVSESGGTAVVFKKAVLGLQVTPQALPGGRIQLQLKINQDRPSDRMVLGMPTIRTRQILTSVLVRDGQTVVLGGIYETSQENSTQGVPFISHLPLIGVLFRQEVQHKSKRELLIFVTPRLLN